MSFRSASTRILISGLSVIGKRAEALNRFLQSYAQLSKVAAAYSARSEACKIWSERVNGLEARLAITSSRQSGHLHQRGS